MSKNIAWDRHVNRKCLIIKMNEPEMFEMSTPTDIRRAGEGHVVDWLKAEKYSIKWNTQATGVIGIEAQSSSKRLLVHVKTAVYPNGPDRLSAEEERAITSRAAILGAQAWEARVQVGSKLELIGNVQWRKI